MVATTIAHWPEMNGPSTKVSNDGGIFILGDRGNGALAAASNIAGFLSGRRFAILSVLYETFLINYRAAYLVRQSLIG
ncbi:hypothetical protein [Rhizobium grahamii]|uniref:hypothetical protein n=1 Tax=Rhizobium grahamii TaxID=1120045 RepID=UPI0005931485|nr:hypothetical protein [Rhizobium grahamii]